MSPLAARAATTSPRRPLVIGIAGLGLLGALAGCSTDTGTDAGTSTGTDSSSGSGATDSPSSSTGGTSASGYTDGTYTEDGSYTAPSGPESITVEVTLVDDTITAVTVTPQAEGGTAASYQKKFAEGISAEVVGKSLDEVEVSRVAGSSLTSGGFNDAIEAIKADAAA